MEGEVVEEVLARARVQGFADAEFNLGNMYKEGRGCTQNYARAVEMYEKAARQGDSRAMNSLGALYLAGHGVPQSRLSTGG